MDINVLIRLIIIEALVVGTQAFLYFGCEIFEKNLHNVKRPIDDKVPRLPWTVVIYSMWFPEIVLFPMVVYYFDPKIYLLYQLATVANNILSTVCYLAYPTTFEREPAPKTSSGKLLSMIYKASFRGLNCAPSLHCATCYTVIVCAVMALLSGFSVGLSLVFILISLGIVISTQTTKQHVLTDLLSAIPLAAVSMIIGLIVVGNVDTQAFLGFFGI